MGRISFFFFSGHAVRGTDGGGEMKIQRREMTFDGGEVLTALESERAGGRLTALEMEM